MHFLGQTLFHLAASEGGGSLSFPSTGETIVLDQAGREAERTGPFDALDLIAWVNGAGVPDIPGTATPALAKNGEWMLSVTHADGSRAAHFIERTHFDVVRAESFGPTGQQRATLWFGDYRDIGPIRFPFSIVGDAKGNRVEMKFKEVIPIVPGTQ